MGIGIDRLDSADKVGDAFQQVADDLSLFGFTATGYIPFARNAPFYRCVAATANLLVCSTNDTLNFSTGDFAIFWKGQLNPAAINQKLVSKKSTSSPETGYRLMMYATGQIEVFLCSDIATGNYAWLKTAARFDDGKIHTIGVKKTSQDKNNWELWVDGILQDVTRSTQSLTGSIYNTDTFYIGADAGGATYTGGVYEFFVFKSTLTPDKMRRYSLGDSIDYDDLANLSVDFRSDGITPYYWIDKKQGLLLRFDYNTNPMAASNITPGSTFAITFKGITGDTQLISGLPAGYALVGIRFKGNNANAVNVIVGTTGGGSDILAATGITGNGITYKDGAGILKKAVSDVNNSHMFIYQSGGWNGANLDATLVITKAV